MARTSLTEFDMNIRKIIARNLKALMKGMTQSKLADLSGIPQSTLSGYLLGNSTPHPDQVQKLADVFNVKKSDIDPRFAKSASKATYSPNLVRIMNASKDLPEEDKERVAIFAENLKLSTSLGTELKEVTTLKYRPTYIMAANDGDLSDDDRKAILKLLEEEEGFE